MTWSSASSRRQDDTLRTLGDSHLLIADDLLPDAADLSPLYRSVQLTVPLASIEEHYSDWQRLVRELTQRGYGSR